MRLFPSTSAHVLQEFNAAFQAPVALPSRSPLHQLLSPGTLLFLRFDMVTNVGVRMRGARERLRWLGAHPVVCASDARPLYVLLLHGCIMKVEKNQSSLYVTYTGQSFIVTCTTQGVVNEFSNRLAVKKKKFKKNVETEKEHKTKSVKICELK